MKRLKLFLLFISVLFSFTLAAQSSTVTKAQKKVEKTKQEQKRKQEKAEIKGRKHHESIQDPKVRKRMKKHRKGDIHVSSYDHKHGFFYRMFHHKKH